MAGVTFECSLIFFLGGGVFESVLISTKFFRKFDRESKRAITLSEHVETCLFFFFLFFILITQVNRIMYT